MALLGKRRRSEREREEAGTATATATATDLPSAASSTSTAKRKRRAVFVIETDQENENPFVLEKTVEETCRPPPTTPRHRHAIPKKFPVTPSQRHRVGFVGKPLTPRTPHTPHTPHTPLTPFALTPRSVAPSVYNEARRLFSQSGANANANAAIIGRAAEKLDLGNFISTRLTTTSSGCVYISGPPGTGKSALVNDICQEFQAAHECCQSYINCMSIRHATDIFAKLLEDVSANDGILRGSESHVLRDIFFSRQCSYLVVLDEIDHLLDIDLELLYSLFEWSLDKRSSLILVGIANALDFTDRFLPRLKSRGLKPHLLPFMPYTDSQIASVITGKLKSLASAGDSPDWVPFLHPTAILFLSKKVAATGDLRRAFDVCRRAIDLIETETRDSELCNAQEPTPTSTPTKTPLLENMNLSSSPSSARSPPSKRQSVDASTNAIGKPTASSSLAHLTAATAPRATIAHVARVTSALFNTGATQRLQDLNLQQKAIVCALVGLEERNRAAAASAAVPDPDTTATTPSRRGRGASGGFAAPTVKLLFDVYAKACRRHKTLHPLTATEFADVVAGLETLGLVSALEARGAGSLLAVGAASGTPSKRGRGAKGGFGALTGSRAGEGRRIAGNVGVGEVRRMVGETKTGSGILETFLAGEE